MVCICMQDIKHCEKLDKGIHRLTDRQPISTIAHRSCHQSRDGKVKLYKKNGEQFQTHWIVTKEESQQ